MARRSAPEFKIPVHPLADIVPQMSEDEFRDLRKSMRDNGWLKEFPGVLLEGKILDGRHRYKAAVIEGVEPQFVDFTGPDPAAFVYAAIQGRNLSESTRALTGAKLLNQQKDKPVADRLQPDDVRQMFGVGGTILTEASRVVKFGDPELISLIENNEIKVKQAAEIVRLPLAEQKKVIAAGPKSVAAKATQLRKDRRGGNSQTSAPGKPGRPFLQEPEKQFDSLTAELLRDLRSFASRFTRYIQTSDGKRFEQYVKTLGIPWIDYSKVKLVDKGEGVKRVNASFVALRPLYRLLVASARDRAFAASTLKDILDDENEGFYDGSRPPPEPENDPAQLVTPESL